MFNIQLPDVATGATATGEMGGDAIAALQKALTAGYGTDVAQLTGGSALRVQSLDKTMKSTIQQNEHFKLFNELAKSGATATVDEWTERNSTGGFLGGSTNSELGQIPAADGGYKRRVGLVKYLMTRAEVSLVSTLGVNIASSKAVEAENAALRLLTDAEFLSFEGDETVVPTEFSGIRAQMEAGVASGDVDGGNVLDAAGSSLASINLLNSAAAQIAGFNNFGRPTHLFMSMLTQSDFDNGLDPAFRVSLNNVPNGGIGIGAPVVGIRTSHGDIKTVNDVFIRDEALQTPFSLRYPAVSAAGAVSAMAPTYSVQPTAGAGAVDAKWTAAHAGNYYYAIASISALGETAPVVSAQVAVAAGQQVSLTIAASAGNTETGYAIYRGRRNGTNALADLRLVKRIPKAGATTVFLDKNQFIPGTTTAYVLNMAQGADAIAWRQLLPMMEFQLYPTATATIPWAQLLFGYLRLAKRRQHVVIKNIVTAGQVWRPFN